MNPYFEKLSSHFEALDERFRALSLRERFILAGGIAAVFFLILDSIAIRPIGDQIQRLDLASERTLAELTSLDEQLRSLAGAELSEEEKRFRDQRELLRTQLREVDSRIQSEISALVPPRAIVSVLEELLAPISSLELVRLQSQVPHRLGSDAQSSEEEASASASAGELYRHAVRVEIEGDFAAALEFLERAEASPWNLLWDRLEYEVKEFPTATIKVDIHTISDQEEWIGV